MAAENQHATLDLAWLGGIMDGEGSIMIIKHNPTGKKNLRYGYRISITNIKIIDNCKRILDFMAIKYCNYTQDRGKDGMRRKMTYLIHITNKKGILIFLEKITPFLIGKRKQAELLYQFLSNWESTDKKNAHFIFKELNERVTRKIGKSSDTNTLDTIAKL